GRSRLVRRARRANHTPSTSTANDSSRWLNSIVVSRLGFSGTTVPLQVGQWLPQPAPEPEIRTNAPCRITTTLRDSVTHAKRQEATENVEMLPCAGWCATVSLLASD